VINKRDEHFLDRVLDEDGVVDGDHQFRALRQVLPDLPRPRLADVAGYGELVRGGLLEDAYAHLAPAVAAEVTSAALAVGDLDLRDFAEADQVAVGRRA
jgi:hypothetical protein